MKNANIKRIKTDRLGMFRYWLKLLKPYHKLAPRELEVMSVLLYYRNEISKEVSNEDMIDKLLFSPETRKAIRKDLNDMKNGVFLNLLTSLRQKYGVLSKDNKIARVLIPKIEPHSNEFKLIFDFEINET